MEMETTIRRSLASRKPARMDRKEIAITGMSTWEEITAVLVGIQVLVGVLVIVDYTSHD